MNKIFFYKLSNNLSKYELYLVFDYFILYLYFFKKNKIKKIDYKNIIMSYKKNVNIYDLERNVNYYLYYSNLFIIHGKIYKNNDLILKRFIKSIHKFKKNKFFLYYNFNFFKKKIYLEYLNKVYLSSTIKNGMVLPAFFLKKKNKGLSKDN